MAHYFYDMKYILILFVFVSFGFIFSSCKKEPKAEFKHAAMKPWFDTHCKSCHGKGGSAVLKWKYDSDDFNNTIKNKMDDIHKEVAVNKSMPPNGITAAELQKFVDWYNAGYPIE